ncbi:MAG: riboflavin synthase [Planctomycetota bacterium]|jgi:riboflavin synthase
MFTGLIETVCTVKSTKRLGDSMLLIVDLGALATDGKLGDSIAINGVCLTITGLNGNLATFDVSSETLSKSNLAGLKPSSQVNAERAMKPTDRFGGHFVLGHIDNTAKILSIENKGRFHLIKFTADAKILSQLIPKGSVALDGISLTIAELSEKSSTVAIIPKTWEKTNLSTLKAGDKVNIEIDIITKTIKKQMEQLLPKQEKLTIEKLKQFGF